MQRRALISIAIAACAATHAPGAMIVDDPSFFTGRPHTYLDFETRGDGSPVGLGYLEYERFGEGEYLAKGIRFSNGQYYWDYVGLPTIGTPLDPDGLGGLGDAVAEFGTAPTVFRSSEGTTIHFLDEVHAFGIGIVQAGFPHSNRPDPDRTTTIVAMDATGGELGRVTLWLDTIDGHFGAYWMTDDGGNDWYTYQYGFLGLSSETAIASIRFENQFMSLFDSFYYSAVPAPGSGVMLALGGVCGAMRRQRR